MSTCCKRSTAWSATRTANILSIEVTSLKAKTVGRSKCLTLAEVGAPTDSWRTNPPRIICLRGITSDFPQLSWDFPEGSGSSFLDPNYVVLNPFPAMATIDSATGSWLNYNPYSYGTNGCLDTSKPTSMQVVSDNISCLESEEFPSKCKRDLFSKKDTVFIKAYDRTLYPSEPGGLARTIYTYIFEFEISWKAQVFTFETNLSLVNDGHLCCGTTNNLSYASTPNVDTNSNLDNIVNSIQQMDYIMASRISQRKQ